MSDAGQETDVGVKRTHDELKSTSPHISPTPSTPTKSPSWTLQAVWGRLQGEQEASQGRVLTDTRTWSCRISPDPLGLKTTSDGDLDEEEIPRREESITLNLFEIIFGRKTNGGSSKGPHQRNNLQGWGEAWEKRGISILPHAETLCKGIHNAENRYNIPV